MERYSIKQVSPEHAIIECEYVVAEYRPTYIDRDLFGRLPVDAAEKIVERLNKLAANDASSMM
jgi:hypothetical protein